LKKWLIDLAKVSCLIFQKPDNPVPGCSETMKYRFMDLNQTVICGGQKAGLSLHLK
jgi:hypothetical protein